MVCLSSFSFPELLFNLARSVMLSLSVLPVTMACKLPWQKRKGVLLEGEVVNFQIRTQRVAFSEAADWLVGVKFQRGFKVCTTPCLHHVQESHLMCSSSIPLTFRKYKACNCQTSNAFVKFPICFHRFPLFFFSVISPPSAFQQLP